jgi:hypothetical protein
MEPKCRRSSVATLVTPSRSAIAIRLASVRGAASRRTQYDELRHALIVSGVMPAGTNLPAGNNRKNAASLLLPARLSSK